ncbi:MAG: hypothetical protein OXQ29_21335, partial [Rhodospirillaceae bacterium]|nr:hypothetical protein [Rhodospirillaceae bacterium]
RAGKTRSCGCCWRGYRSSALNGCGQPCSEASGHALRHRDGIDFIEVEQHWHLVFSSFGLAAQVEFTTIEPGSAKFRFIL